MSTMTLAEARPVTRRSAPAPIPFSRVVAVEARKTFDTRSGFWLLTSIGITATLATVAVLLWAPDSELTYDTFAAAIGFPMAVILPMVAAVAISARIPTLDISQNPERVSNDLRSSTETIRDIGIRRGAGRTGRAVSRSRTPSMVEVVMLLLLHAGSLR